MLAQTAADGARRGWDTSLRMLAMLLATAVIAVVMPGCPPASGGLQGTQHAAVGKKLTTLELQGLTGSATDVKLADVAGKVVLVNFWGTWCPPCVEEFPHIAELGKKYADQDDFRLLAVSSAPGAADLDDLRSDTEDFLKSNQADLPTYADVDDRTRAALGRTAGWQGYPTTVILDRQGTIRAVWEGYSAGTEQQMDALVADLLAK